MNRDIKFRAWDYKIKHFHYWDNKIQLHENIFWYMTKDEKMPLMQYTGLNDKNGKEIYEGDVVKTNIECGTGVVIFIDGSFVITGFNGVIQCVFWAKEIEVIGNIYENPELLKPELAEVGK